MRLVAVIMIVVLLTTVIGAQVNETNSSDTPETREPDFLKNIGPQEPHTDNPWAAVVTAIVVAGVILRGLHVAKQDD